MTRMLDDAIAAVRRLPSARQDEIAEAMIGLAGLDEEAIDPTHLAAITEGLAQVERGEYASEKDVEAAFRRFGT